MDIKQHEIESKVPARELPSNPLPTLCINPFTMINLLSSVTNQKEKHDSNQAQQRFKATRMTRSWIENTQNESKNAFLLSTAVKDFIQHLLEKRFNEHSNKATGWLQTLQGNIFCSSDPKIWEEIQKIWILDHIFAVNKANEQFKNQGYLFRLATSAESLRSIETLTKTETFVEVLYGDSSRLMDHLITRDLVILDKNEHVEIVPKSDSHEFAIVPYTKFASVSLDDKQERYHYVADEADFHPTIYRKGTAFRKVYERSISWYLENIKCLNLHPGEEDINLEESRERLQVYHMDAASTALTRVNRIFQGTRYQMKWGDLDRAVEETIRLAGKGKLGEISAILIGGGEMSSELITLIPETIGETADRAKV